MNYLFSDYISRLANKDARLEAVDFSVLAASRISASNQDGMFLVEEKQLDRLKELDHRLNLVVLTEERDQDAFETPHRIVRTVYKYDVYPSVLAEIFQERHPITFFTATLATLMHRESLPVYCNLIQSEVCCILDAENNQSNAFFYHHIPAQCQYLYTNVLDFLDPPLEYVENTILELASKKNTDIISIPLDSAIQARLLDLCDVAVLLMTPECATESSLIVGRYPHVLPVCTERVDGFHWIGDPLKLRERIIEMKKEVRKAEILGSSRSKNQNSLQ